MKIAKRIELQEEKLLDTQKAVVNCHEKGS